VLDDLARWGLPLMTEQKPTDAVRSHWLAAALELMLTDRHPDAPPATLELQTGDQPITIKLRGGAIQTHLGAADNPDATLAGSPRPIMGLLLGLLKLADAKTLGISYQGDEALLDRIGAETNLTASPS
jgi:hypothetical protein